MEKSFLEKMVTDFVRASPENYTAKEAAIRPSLAGLRFFDEPLFGYAAADDVFFAEFKKPGIIGPDFMSPNEWLPEAKSVISVFLPFTIQVRTANRKNMDWPADEWLHARVEGQMFQDSVCRYMEGLFIQEGFSALAPMIDPRRKWGNSSITDKADQSYYTSNWSERHIAYAAGLGTFGLSRGLITQRGVAGRFVSTITSGYFEPDKRSYTGVYDYCTNCGACAQNCPAGAITMENGKMHYPCSVFLDRTRAKYAPRYGCGKCQVSVPCEDKAPGI